MTHPVDVIGADAVAALREAGWIVVREDSIRLAQAMAREEGREEKHGRRANSA
ncbi:hypothetical protein [Shinella zoogloeoides]|uniref:hypothetical protein n=1 Tax=Shinella zoogloeoides TaxID=352475 RepID=UPI001F58C236|nr:hypothetical protein [Shinella zoogloeoides]